MPYYDIDELREYFESRDTTGDNVTVIVDFYDDGRVVIRKMEPISEE